MWPAVSDHPTRSSFFSQFPPILPTVVLISYRELGRTESVIRRKDNQAYEINEFSFWRNSGQ